MLPKIVWMRCRFRLYFFEIGIWLGRGMPFLEFGHRFILIYGIFSWGKLRGLAGEFFLRNPCIYLIPVVLCVVSHIIIKRKLHWFLDFGRTTFLSELSEDIKLQALASSEAFVGVELEQSLEKGEEEWIYKWEVIWELLDFRVYLGDEAFCYRWIQRF